MVGMECKICLKKFSNGKALGGHMRSHYATLPLPPKMQQLSTESLTESTSETPKTISIASDSAVVESKSTRRPSPDESSEKVLNNDLSTEEDVALCLVMLSRDVWYCRRSSSSSTSRIHKCERCDTVFKSSQGLGSHRSTHDYFKKFNSLLTHVNKKKKNNMTNIVDDVVHDCQLCGRRFNSAQALGGHKRWHLLVSKNLVGTIINDNSISNISSHEDAFTIDLNHLPPPTEMEYEDVHNFISMHN